jgi:hypothetical protein
MPRWSNHRLVASIAPQILTDTSVSNKLLQNDVSNKVIMHKHYRRPV